MSANNLHQTIRKALWLVIFIISLFYQGQNVKAQFGLFDTVWTMKNQEIYFTSSNDSLLFLYGSKDSSIYLVKTLNPIDTVWWSTTYPYTNSPRKFLNNDTEILFDTWDRVNNTHYYKIVNKETFETIDSVFYKWSTYPFSGCLIYRMGISEVDTSIYYSGYCNVLDIKANTYKVNYKTGATTITSDSLPYFALTISEDGQYVAGVYYTGGQGTNVPYKEILEVRKISDYSLVFRNESKYSDWTPSFTPYQWVSDYRLILSANGKFLTFTHRLDYFLKIYDLEKKVLIVDEKKSFPTFLGFSKVSNEALIHYFEKKSADYYYMNFTIINLNNNSRKYIEFPDSVIFKIENSNLIMKDEYLLGLKSHWKQNGNYRYIGEIALLKLNFDLTSIHEPENPIQGTLYPNPASDYINVDVSFLQMQESAIKVFDVFGNCVLTTPSRFHRDTPPEEGNYRIDISALPSGVYFLRIGNEKPMKFMVVR